MIELLKRRRSIRRYLEKKPDRDTLETLKKALLRCPSSRDLKPCEFIFITDPKILRELSRAKSRGAAFLAGAPLGVVICGNETISDTWIEDCSIAAITLHYTATSLNLGSCWIQIRNRQHESGIAAEDIVKRILKIPEPLRVEAIVAVGYPAESKSGIRHRTLAHERIHTNGYKV